jgi:DNA primase
MSAILDAAKPLADVLFSREATPQDLATPERRARLDQRLKALTGAILDPAVRGHYERDIRDRLYQALRSSGQGRGGLAQGRQLTRPGQGMPGQGMRHSAGPQHKRMGQGGSGRGGNKAWAQPLGASDSLRNSSLAIGTTVTVPQREALLLRAVVTHPWLIEENAENLATLTLTSDVLVKLKDAILSAYAREKTLDSEELRTHLNQRGFASTLVAIEQMATHRRDRFAEASADRDTVHAGWSNAYALHERTSGGRRSLEAAERAWHEDPSPEAFEQIVELQHRLVAQASDDAASNDASL